MFSFLHPSALPEAVSFTDAGILLGSWFGAGFVEPLRAGLAVASAWPLAVLLSRRFPALAIAALAVTLAGTWAADSWETLVAVKDDRRIVIDEVAGYLAGMALLGRSGWLAAGGFAGLFLLLDRLKPWPFYWLEAIPGSVGVMLDDIAVALALGAAILFAMAVRRWLAARNDTP